MKYIRYILHHPAAPNVRYPRAQILSYVQATRDWARAGNFPKTEQAAALACCQVMGAGRPSPTVVTTSPAKTTVSVGTQTDDDGPITSSSPVQTEPEEAQVTPSSRTSFSTQTEACQTDPIAPQLEVESDPEQNISLRSTVQQEVEEISYDAYLKRKRLEEAEDAEVEALLLPSLKRRVVENKPSS
jgi:hypothetical protein